MEVTGAQALVRSLECQGVDIVFGLPGGAILPAYDPLRSSSLRHVLVRHEQGAGHAAEGYAWATGRVGVCMATSGPGATNLVTALADAYMDSVPIVAITGQVPTAMIGTDAFQESDITGITGPITKHNELVTEVERIPAAIAEAFHIAATGPTGPGARRPAQGHPAGAVHLVLAARARPARLQAARRTRCRADRASRPAAAPGPQAGPLRRRRRDQVRLARRRCSNWPNWPRHRWSPR